MDSAPAASEPTRPVQQDSASSDPIPTPQVPHALPEQGNPTDAAATRERLVAPLIEEEKAHIPRLVEAAKRGDYAAVIKEATAHAANQIYAAETVAEYEKVRDAAVSDIPMDERLATLLEGTRLLLGGQVAAILLMDEQGEHLWPRASLGFETTLGVRPVAVNGLMRNVIRTGKPLVIPDVQPDAEFRVGLIEEGIHSLVAAPVRMDGLREGVLVCGHRERDRFDDADAALLQILADQMGAGLQRRRHLEAQTRGRRQAELTSQFKTDLLNMATHDIKTPLSTLALQLQIIADVQVPEEQRKRSVAMMQRNVTRLTAMLDDFLDLARIQADRLTINPVRLRVAKLIPEIMENFAPLAQQHGLKLETEPADGIEALGDERRIVQVLANLVSNAVRYSPRGGTIRLLVHDAPDHVEIHVRDEGRGMTHGQLAQLFQPFVQLHEAPGNSKGSGLGLYLCKAIVTAHGGRLWITSEGPGKGTDAGFTLPKQKSAEADVGPQAA